MRDPFEVLGVQPDASPEELQAAQRRLAREHHPDRVAMLGPEAQATATKVMAEVNEAYRLATDPVELARHRTIAKRRAAAEAWAPVDATPRRQGAQPRPAPGAPAASGRNVPPGVARPTRPSQVRSSEGETDEVRLARARRAVRRQQRDAAAARQHTSTSTPDAASDGDRDDVAADTERSRRGRLVPPWVRRSVGVEGQDDEATTEPATDDGERSEPETERVAPVREPEPVASAQEPEPERDEAAPETVASEPVASAPEPEPAEVASGPEPAWEPEPEPAEAAWEPEPVTEPEPAEPARDPEPAEAAGDPDLDAVAAAAGPVPEPEPAASDPVAVMVDLDEPAASEDDLAPSAPDEPDTVTLDEAPPVQPPRTTQAPLFVDAPPPPQQEPAARSDDVAPAASAGDPSSADESDEVVDVVADGRPPSLVPESAPLFEIPRAEDGEPGPTTMRAPVAVHRTFRLTR